MGSGWWSFDCEWIWDRLPIVSCGCVRERVDIRVLSRPHLIRKRGGEEDQVPMACRGSLKLMLEMNILTLY